MTIEKALQIIAGLCSKKECCSRDVLEKLKRWEFSEEDRQKILAFLQQHQFVDDERFARIYAEDKFRFNGWGKQKIAMMLRQKGISSEVIAYALDSIGIQQYTDSCLELLKQKVRSLPEEEPYKIKARLIRFALGRGFDYDTVRQCLSRLGEFPADDEDQT